jgi:hypothetical protein
LVETIDDTIRCVVTHAGLMLQNTPLWRMPRFPNGIIFPFLSINCVPIILYLVIITFYLYIYIFIIYLYSFVLRGRASGVAAASLSRGRAQ